MSVFVQLRDDGAILDTHFHFVNISSRLKMDLLKKYRIASAIKTIAENIKRLSMLKEKSPSAPAAKTRTNGINMSPAI